jgi:general secretion pathway protein K
LFSIFLIKSETLYDFGGWGRKAVATGFFDVTSKSAVRRLGFSGAYGRPASRLPRRLGANSPRSGFALVAVIWSLGLISLLAVAVIVGARYRTRVASSDASMTATKTAAESAVNLAIALSLAGATQQTVKFPLRCQMPGGERAIVDIEEETGKVDLNTATPEVLTRLFAALTDDQSAGMRIAASIVKFRELARGPTKSTDTQSTSASKPGGAQTPANNSKKPGFATIMQLDQIDGVSASLFRTALRFVTVRSTHAEPDKDAASPALRRLLKLDQGQGQVTPTRAPPATGNVTIRADIRAPNGNRFIREALVSLGSEDGRPFRVHEWRHADIDSEAPAPGAEIRYSDGDSTDSCLRIGRADGG